MVFEHLNSWLLRLGPDLGPCKQVSRYGTALMMDSLMGP